MKKRQVKCLGKDIYTLSDLKESNEELSKVYFKNLLKNPKLLNTSSRSDLIQYHSIPQLPKIVMLDTSKFTSIRYGLEYLLCSLRTFVIMFYHSPFSFTRGRANAKYGGVVDGT